MVECFYDAPRFPGGAVIALEARSGNPSLADADPITTWIDQSGYNNHATGSGGTRPTWEEGNIAYTLYDGTDDFLEIADEGRLDAANLTLALVVLGSVSGNLVLASKWNQTGNQRSWALVKTAGDVIDVQVSSDGTNADAVSNATTSGALNQSDYYILTYRNQDGVGSVRLNGTTGTVGTTKVPFVSTSPIWLGRDGTAGLGPRWRGRIVFFSMWPKALSRHQIRRIEQFLSRKYRINLSG